MSRGGYRPGAGRPRISRAMKLPGPIAGAGKVGGETPLALLLALMNDEAQPVEVRMRAASLALPFMHAKPAAPTKREEAERRATMAESGSEWDTLLND